MKSREWSSIYNREQYWYVGDLDETSDAAKQSERSCASNVKIVHST